MAKKVTIRRTYAQENNVPANETLDNLTNDTLPIKEVPVIEQEQQEEETPQEETFVGGIIPDVDIVEEKFEEVEPLKPGEIPDYSNGRQPEEMPVKDVPVIEKENTEEESLPTPKKEESKSYVKAYTDKLNSATKDTDKAKDVLPINENIPVIEKEVELNEELPKKEEPKVDPVPVPGKSYAQTYIESLNKKKEETPAVKKETPKEGKPQEEEKKPVEELPKAKAENEMQSAPATDASAPMETPAVDSTPIAEEETKTPEQEFVDQYNADTQSGVEELKKIQAEQEQQYQQYVGLVDGWVNERTAQLKAAEEEARKNSLATRNAQLFGGLTEVTANIINLIATANGATPAQFKGNQSALGERLNNIERERQSRLEAYKSQIDALNKQRQELTAKYNKAKNDSDTEIAKYVNKRNSDLTSLLHKEEKATQTQAEKVQGQIDVINARTEGKKAEIKADTEAKKDVIEAKGNKQQEVDNNRTAGRIEAQKNWMNSAWNKGEFEGTDGKRYSSDKGYRISRGFIVDSENNPVVRVKP